MHSLFISWGVSFDIFSRLHALSNVFYVAMLFSVEVGLLSSIIMPDPMVLLPSFDVGGALG